MEAVTGADLSFVNLGITIQHLPNSITVFGFRIAFYGIIIGLGMLAGMAIAFSDARRRDRIQMCIWILHCTVLYFPSLAPGRIM